MDRLHKTGEIADKMSKIEKSALIDLLYQLADDELILGHRDSEWLGIAPGIEEDVAFSSVAQDEVGHATYYYNLLEQLGEGVPDELAFDRDANSRRNTILTERENGDWAYSIARHWLYDVFDDIRLRALCNSTYQPLRFGAVKMCREEYYHLRHFQTWVRRLSLAGGEALERLQLAMDELFPDVLSLFDLGEYADTLYQSGVLPITSEEMHAQWTQTICGFLQDVNLSVPPKDRWSGVARGMHAPELNTLLATLTEVHDIDRTATW